MDLQTNNMMDYDQSVRIMTKINSRLAESVWLDSVYSARVTTHFSSQNSLIFPDSPEFVPDFYGPVNSVGSALNSHTGNPGSIPGANALFIQTLPAFH